MKKTIQGMICLGMFVLTAPLAQAYSVVTLEDAVNKHLTLFSGDKMFNHFFASSQDIALKNVQLRYGPDVLDAYGNFGICFEMDFGVRNGNVADLGFGFLATATASDRVISDVHLSMQSSVDPGGIASVSESVDSLYGTFDLSTYDLGSGINQYTDVGYVIPGAKSVLITKDALIIAGASQNSNTRITEICQYFSQSGPVPEPGTVGFLIAGGLFSTRLLWNRRKK